MYIKNIIFLSLVFFSWSLSSQVEVELTIENQSLNGSDFFFDIYLTRTTANPGSGDLYLGGSDFVLTFNSSSFNSPDLISYDPDGLLEGLCTFVSTSGNTSNTRGEYFGKTVPVSPIAGDDIIINLGNIPVPSQPFFDQRVAKIDNSSSTHRLGRFKITGANSGNVNLQWNTASGKTEVFTHANTSPWNTTKANLIATNPSNFPLPVELISFEASREEHGTVLFWQTASETNNAYFDIEHSTNGTFFENIGRVIGNGTTAEPQYYEFTDEKSNESGMHYYRLKQVDFDGAYEYSKVVTVEIDDDLSHLSFSPNPSSADNLVNFQVGLENFKSGRLMIFDISGKVFFVQKIESNASTIDLSGLSKACTSVCCFPAERNSLVN